jgi:hypothetical protein
MTFVMTQQSENQTSLQITVAREFAKNYRLLHRKSRDPYPSKSASEETNGKTNSRQTNYTGLS